MRLFVNHHKPLEYKRVLCTIITVAKRKGQGAVQHPISVRLKSRNLLTGPLRWEELGTERWQRSCLTKMAGRILSLQPTRNGQVDQVCLPSTAPRALHAYT